MSYKTVASRVFPPINTQNFRTNQEFNALQVKDPRRTEITRTPPDYNQYDSPRKNYDNDRDRDQTASRLEMLAAQQDQLLKNQFQVAQNQGDLSKQLNAQNSQLTQALIQRAIGNKDAMIANLQQQQGLDWESHLRDQLQQHLKVIVGCVQGLNKDIEALETEIRGRDFAVVGTNKAVNKLEVHHVTMLQDVRARIARCDASIAKHTKDLTHVFEELRRLEGQQYTAREKLNNDIHRLEAEVLSITGEFDRQAGEQRSELNHMKKDAFNRINALEDRSKTNMLQIQDMMEDNRSALMGHLDRMDTKFSTMINKVTDGFSNVMHEIDQKIADGIYSVDARLHTLEDGMVREKEKQKDLEQNITYNVMEAMKEHLNYQDDQLARAKQEFRESCTELQESIRNMKGITEGKRKIMGNQLKREIGKVKQTMFIEMPDQSAIVYPR